MTSFWRRRVAESARQNTLLPIGRDKHFQPTSISRVVATFIETKKFADALKKYDRQTVQHVKMIAANMQSTEQFMNTHTPRIFSESNHGDAVPTDPDSKVGPTVDYEKLRAAGEDGAQRLQQYVMEPLRNWLKNYDEVVVAMQQLEQVRLVLDSRRRTVAAMEGKLTNVRSKAEDESAPDVEKCLQKKHRKEMKMNQVLEDFHAKEQATYSNLISLVNDVKYVQQHVHKLFELYREIYADACDAFHGPGKTHHLEAPSDRTMPIYSHPGTASDHNYEQDGIPVHSQSDHGPGISASNDAFSYNASRGDVKHKRQDRYGGNVDESGGYCPV